MAADAAERTEPATQKRRDEARKRGEVAQSRDLSGVLLLAASFALLASSAGERVVHSVVAQSQAAWSGSLTRPTGVGDFQALLLHTMTQTGWSLAPLAVGLMLAGVSIHLLQTGLLWSTEALAPRASRLSPARGVRRLFGVQPSVELLKAVLKVLFVGAVLWRTAQPDLATVAGLSEATVADGLRATLDLLGRLLLGILAPLLLLGLADLAWSHWRYERDLRMTREEVRDEIRQREGSPHVRGRLRAMQRELGRSRMITAVARADVVIVNPTHFAVALLYQRPEMRAPRVIAKGRSHLALRIRAAAEEHRVPIVQDAPLAQILYRTVPLDREIPESLFQAVAEILAQVYRLDRHRGSSWRRAS